MLHVNVGVDEGWGSEKMEHGPLVRGLWRVGLEASGVLSTGLARAVCIIYGADSPADSSFAALLPWLCSWTLMPKYYLESFQCLD